MRLVSIVLLPLLLFAADLGTGWVAVGSGATVENTQGVLTLRYQAGAMPRGMAVLPGGGAAFSRVKSVRFEVKTDSAFAVGFVMAEKKPDGGNYSAIIWSNGDSWQPVVLTAADFTRNEGVDDPVDKDGKLDFDQVENVALLDFSQFLSGATSNPRMYAEPHRGAHVISMRGLAVSGEDVPSTFHRPQSSWVSNGGATFEQAADGATIIRYKGQSDLWTAFTRLEPPHDFTGATYLSMDIQSDRDVQLVISIHERRSGENPGARYNTDFFVPAGTGAEHREVVLSAFHLDENGPADPDGNLNVNAIQSVTILDVSGEAGANKISIRDLALVKR